MNKFRLVSFFVILAMLFSFANVSPAAAAGPIIQFDANALALQNGDTVTAWGGQSAAGTPTFLTNQTPNGRPAVQFNGGGDRMGDNVSVPASAVADWILVAVIKPQNIGAYHNLADDDPAGRPMLWIDPNFNYEMNYGGGTGAKAAGTGTDGWDIVIADSRLNQLYINSPIPNATGRSSISYSVTKLYDFFHRDGLQTYQGLVAEMRIYTDRAEFGGDFAALHSEMVAKYFGTATTMVTFQEGTATFSQNYPCCALPVDQAVDGYIGSPVNGVLNGWAIHPGVGQDQIAVWETTSDVNASQLDFKLYQYWGGAHNFGRFRLSYTTDGRSTFADGLNEGGDVTASWTVLTGATITSTGGETFTVLGDNSILVSGNNPATTVYSLSFSGSFSGITGIRLEALSDASLPFSGPGRQANGNFTLTEITLDATAPTDTSAPTAGPTQSPAANGLGWNNTDVTVTWNWSDEAGGSGIDNSACTTSSTSTGEGELTLTATCKDLAGNEGSASYTVMVDKTLPVADAGLDQQMHAGYTVNLDGSASSDDNTLPEALSYNWSFFSTPAGNTATLNNVDTATPSFTPNVSGEYVAQLIVTDGADNDSASVFVTLSSLNMAPTASATATPMLPLLGQAVSLDGTTSSDPDGDTISYLWTVTSKPVGSAASLTNATSAVAIITPDVSGTYEMTLTVSDFLEVGTPVTVSFVASTAEEFSQMQIITVSTVVTALEPGEITTAGNQTAFGNFLANTMEQIQNGKLDKAIADLEKAIARTDGCALRGAPDGNGAGMDWVTTCDAQASIYNSLVEALQVLQD